MGDQLRVVLLVLVLVFLVNRTIRHIRIARFKKQHGCKAGVRISQSERILGYGLYKTQVQASKSRTLLQVGRKRFADNGNTWRATIMGQAFFNTIDPENVKAILATNFKDFDLGPRQEAFGPLLGQGIFTTDGAQWEHSRALVRPSFTRAQVADLDTFETHIQQFISKIPRDGTTIDLQPLFFQLTLRLRDRVPLRRVRQLPEQQQRLGARPLRTPVRLGPEQTGEPEFVHQFVDQIVSQALEKSPAHEGERYVFLTEMLQSTRDPTQLRDELLNILLAGRDTTASLLSNTFHVLARQPHIWKNLKAEVDALEGVKPDYETLRNMKYLKNLLSESLRLCPVVPGHARFTNKTTTLPRGGGFDGASPIYIPHGAIVVYSVYNMQRRRDLYGADAEEFNPDRWDEGLRPGWAYLPFNGGPRICVGQIFALTEASYTIVRLLQEFAGIEDRDGSPWEEALSLTVASAKGVAVAFTPR
ncbi:cytochrome P450 52A1 [Diplocarpon rosae]|nr:cytochrome P450 52A1 [Diplocarpon rosae]